MNYILASIVILTPIIIGFALGMTFPANQWYTQLNKPSFAPPPWLFGVAWSILYICVGLSAYLAFGLPSALPLSYWMLYIMHLIPNFLFTPVNFGLRSLFGGAILTTLTLVLALMVMLQYLQMNKMLSFLLFIPYIAWLIFASILSWSLFQMN